MCWWWKITSTPATRLSMLLRLHGHEVQLARTGPAALEMASASRPDVVLLDIGLPGMDGYQVAKRLREQPEFKDVMMCALTGYTPSEADRQRQQETGFDHYFVKPVEDGETARTVRNGRLTDIVIGPSRRSAEPRPET